MNKYLKSKDQEESLKILNALENDATFTQRELSKQVDLSLGKINFLVSALVQAGYIKAQRFKNSKKKSAYLYLLTPLGIKQKAVLTRNFLKRKIQEYNRLKKEIETLKKAAKD